MHRHTLNRQPLTRHTLKRRTLLSLLAAGSASGAKGWGLGKPAVSGTGGRPRHVLILLELRGGNDGLNTVAPIRDPIYRQSRPSLALPEADALPLTNGLALHPALAPLLPLWHSRRLGFALGVGWPRPNRSHFKAADQWATASPTGEGPGWIAAAFDQRGAAGPLVALGPSGCEALEGGQALALQLDPARQLSRNAAPLEPDRAGANPILRRMLELELRGNRELERLRNQLAPLPPGLEIPRGGLGQQVAMALRLLGGEACPPVLQLAQGGFDTHANQANRHNRVLAELASALAALAAGLEQLRHRPQVSLLAVSEFGRRLRQNGSGGTDHGAASIAVLLGDQVPAPLLGSYPSLNKLDSRGDLIASLNPADLYRQVLAGT